MLSSSSFLNITTYNIQRLLQFQLTESIFMSTHVNLSIFLANENNPSIQSCISLAWSKYKEVTSYGKTSLNMTATIPLETFMFAMEHGA